MPRFVPDLVAPAVRPRKTHGSAPLSRSCFAGEYFVRARFASSIRGWLASFRSALFFYPAWFPASRQLHNRCMPRFRLRQQPPPRLSKSWRCMDRKRRVATNRFAVVTGYTFASLSPYGPPCGYSVAALRRVAPIRIALTWPRRFGTRPARRRRKQAANHPALS
jgi:hypothetical protein